MEKHTIDITPSVSVIGHFRNQAYTHWGALAEYVDNALDSYIKNKERLKQVDSEDYKLRVTIIFDTSNEEIIVRDNAAGISADRLEDAFKTGEPPEDNTGLSEFGVGMKASSTWWSDLWQVTSKAIDEKEERTIQFDIPKIIRTKTEELNFEITPRPAQIHYTVIHLKKISKFPKPSQIKTINEHLASIYRYFINSGELELVVESNNSKDILSFQLPKTLYAPFYEDTKGPNILWRKEIKFDFTSPSKKNFSVKGYVGILEQMSYKYNGFTLLRRGRVIEGNQGDNSTYKPDFMGPQNGAIYRRLFGELHLDGFEVAYDKGQFIVDTFFDQFITILKETLEEDKDMPILLQADKHAARATKKQIKKAAEEAVKNVSKIDKKDIQGDLLIVKTDSEESRDIKIADKDKTYWETFNLNFKGAMWTVFVECSYDESITALFEVGTHFLPNDKRSPNTVGIRLSLVHEYMTNFAGTDKKTIQAVLRIIVSMGLTEALYEELGNQEFSANSFRQSMNDLLSKSLSKIK